ncbi:MAG: hypothetical protein KBE72_10085, partial [Syntrophaceae bacterium]|nr:hypothetical protein [Syntrophaceae bacterium]MBP9532648.1 hypothetical protein [Syntrophaceae bacterium]
MFSAGLKTRTTPDDNPTNVVRSFSCAQKAGLKVRTTYTRLFFFTPDFFIITFNLVEHLIKKKRGKGLLGALFTGRPSVYLHCKSYTCRDSLSIFHFWHINFIRNKAKETKKPLKEETDHEEDLRNNRSGGGSGSFDGNVWICRVCGG